MSQDHEKKPCAVININCGGEGPQPDCHCKDQENEFAEAFSSLSQTISPSSGSNAPGGSIQFEVTKYASKHLDLSGVGSSGQITVNLAGWYDVAAGMTGTLNPIPAPLPVFTFSLFQNGVIVPGSTFSNVPLSPAQTSNEITADTYMHFNKGDVLTIASTSSAPVYLSAPKIGTTAQTNSAYIKIQLLKADSHSAHPQVHTYNTASLAVIAASTSSYTASTTVNLSQLPADAVSAQSASNAVLASANSAQTALTAAVAASTPVSYAAATAALANVITAANATIVAANNAVATLNPANTALLVAANSSLSSASALLASNELVAL